jgi:hypothetical protein
VTRRFALTLLLCLAAPAPAHEPAPVAPASARGVLHVVLIALAPDAPPDAAAEIVADSKHLLARIPGVLDVRAGRKAAAERDAHVKDYDVALSVRLSSAADLAVYASDPRHLELLAKHRRRIAGLRVIDFFDE